MSFALDGVDYEIDLSAAHADALREILGEYVAKAHKTPARTRRGRKAAGRPNANVTAEIRRLASESARKVTESQEADDPPDTPAPTSSERMPVNDRNGTSEPLHTLVIPFQEAGL
ncbi:MAG TPA: histone-like nucleoid-structuring protein Lsr2 [Pseudonocardiaceae bacterium]|nr:histone-like nucleoid-structuring protein Lsr2 [Pseudonocardiaceae bacterium]